ncbi:MAG: secondary thiamine-phosphate synthase enzyme YjbQ [Thermotogota bacterium]|nr:secondary thiamine-phosphate synthase enzyme YjbQ [Thermotogota bacterium]
MVVRKSLKTSKRNEFVNITSLVQNALSESNSSDGFITVYVPHTTAGVTINESADPDVVYDILNHLEKMVPPNKGYAHIEGNADAHIKSSLVGCSITVPYENGKLLLGTWQGIFFCEFDGPRNRKLIIQM